MMIHLLIVDALNLIRRIHAVQGSPCVNACRHALQQLIQHSRPTHAVAVFDEDDRRDSWRHQILPDYKAGRSPMPENLQQEMPQLREAFAELGVASWHSPGNEADDLAATLAAKVAGGGHQVTIVSTDKGYCQLLAPNVQIRDYFQKRWLDMPFVQQEFGVQPQQLPDYWGLAGIGSSKIPGVAGIGPKPPCCCCSSRAARTGSISTGAGAGEMARQAGAAPRAGLRQQTGGRCAPICRWTVTCSSCACRYNKGAASSALYQA